MATFALDPMEFVPQGFDIIDGGELRLPRTFFAPAVAPDRHHEDYAIAIVEPAPLPEEIAIFRNMVSNFVVNNLGRAVLEAQPWIQGVGLFRFRSALARQALVDHPPFNLGNDRFLGSSRMMRELITEQHRVFAVDGLCCSEFHWIIGAHSTLRM